MSLDPWPDYISSRVITDDNCTMACHAYEFATFGYTDDPPYSVLFDAEMPNNLLTCGLWASMAVAQGHPTGPDREAFLSLGLDYEDSAYMSKATESVSTALTVLYKTVTTGTYLYDGKIPESCGSTALFGPTAAMGIRAMGIGGEILKLFTLQNCIDEICSPRELNPDLGGIGVSFWFRWWYYCSIEQVYVSLLLQSFFAVAAPLALLILEIWSLQYEKKRDRILQLSTTLMDFHKNQCYFISAVEVAALVLVTKEPTGILRLSATFDVMFTVPLALNGLVPVIFTLLIISRYGRLSWPIMLLTLLTVVLSTASLATTYSAWQNVDAFDSESRTLLRNTLAFAQALCGSKFSNTLLMHPQEYNFAVIWTIYLYCTLWLLSCIIAYLATEPLKKYRLNRFLQSWINIISVPIQKIKVLRGFSPLAHIISILLWAFFFGYHFYLYSLFSRHKLVTSNWTLGQIIAIFLWVPTIIDFVYTELGRLPCIPLPFV